MFSLVYIYKNFVVIEFYENFIILVVKYIYVYWYDICMYFKGIGVFFLLFSEEEFFKYRKLYDKIVF